MKNHSITQTDYYLKIKSIIENLDNAGILKSGSGYCLSMSDIILKLLHKEGIKSHLVECSLVVTLKSPPGLYLMGYPGFHGNNYDADKMMQTHVVCVTETEVPILIDLSISHIDKEVPYICAPILENYEHTNLSEYEFESSSWVYTQKKSTDMQIPKLHQMSILDRIKKDNSFQKQITFIKYFLFLLLTVSSLNFIRGTYDFYQTYINSNNGWGPNDTHNR